MIEIESLLVPTAEEPPCGPDLEYDAAFLALDQSARGKPEQQFGETVIAAEEPVWGDVRTAATELLARSKDLRAAILLVRAWVHTDGYAGLLPGLQLIQQLLERYWDEIHPRLDPDEANDPTMRMNALAPLADVEGVVRDLRGAFLVDSRQHGSVLVRDVEIALGKLPRARAASRSRSRRSTQFSLQWQRTTPDRRPHRRDVPDGKSALRQYRRARRGRTRTRFQAAARDAVCGAANCPARAIGTGRERGRGDGCRGWRSEAHQRRHPDAAGRTGDDRQNRGVLRAQRTDQSGAVAAQTGKTADEHEFCRYHQGHGSRQHGPDRDDRRARARGIVGNRGAEHDASQHRLRRPKDVI
ncbi:MAG: type VI secretion system ImpA family N-terminal domain-containing protein [Sterolibacteriaceae bacterium]|nr:type VI secretion system ImpA family N-terminal domain-containing protein [Candidatus Methylophosphatis haderslevensis]